MRSTSRRSFEAGCSVGASGCVSVAFPFVQRGCGTPAALACAVTNDTRPLTPTEIAEAGERHRRYLIRVAANCGIQRADREDVLQEAVAALSFKSFVPGERGERGLRSWLASGVANKALAHHKRAGRQKRKPAPAAEFELFYPSSFEPHRALDIRDALDRALDALDADTAELVRLRCIEGLTWIDISLKLGCPLTTAQSRFRKALGFLREQLAAFGSRSSTRRGSGI